MLIELVFHFKKDLDSKSIIQLCITFEGVDHVMTFDEEKKELAIFAEGSKANYLKSLMLETMVMSAIDETCLLEVTKKYTYEGGK